MQQDHTSNSGETFNVPEGLCRQFSINEILAATNDFSDSLVIGQGGFAKVYKGEIDNGTHTVAIKKSKSMSPELRKEFRDEILMVSKFRHSHLASLIGYCETDNEMILVYEYMAGGTLDDNLYKLGKNGNNRIPLCWVERLKICIGAARGLDYLHTGTGINNKVIHRDIKSSNILLDEDRSTAKISDFGVSKIGPANQPDTRVMTRVVGTFGYLDPDYYTTGFLTSKSDVYAFGVVLFELLCGRPAVDSTLDEDQRSLAGWAQLCVKKGKVDRIIDLNLKSEIEHRSLWVYVKVANRCLNTCPKERPTMTEVLAELVLALSSQETGKQNGKKSDNAIKVGGSKIAEKLLEFLSVKPQPISVSLATEAAPTHAQALNIDPILLADLAHIPPDEMREITNKLSAGTLICTGTNAILFHGFLKSGRALCIKILLSNKLSEEEFIAQVTKKLMLKHENVVKLLGFCLGGNYRVLAYEYAPNGSLHDILHGQKHIKSAQPGPVLSWSKRVKIAFGAAKGLAYLLEEADSSIVNYCITSSNVLLVEDYNDAKIAVTDLWNEAPNISSHIYSIRNYMDSGYCAPKIGLKENVTDFGIPIGEFGVSAWLDCLVDGTTKSKSNIYSFGVVLLELLTGRKPIDHRLPRGQQHLVEWATREFAKHKVEWCIDPRIKLKCPPTEAAEMGAIAALCMEHKAGSMSIVVERLQRLAEAGPRYQ